eukprot:9269079-Pyramimonas_sp.AAC.1
MSILAAAVRMRNLICGATWKGNCCSSSHPDRFRSGGAVGLESHCPGLLVFCPSSQTSGGSSV